MYIKKLPSYTHVFVTKFSIVCVGHEVMRLFIVKINIYSVNKVREIKQRNSPSPVSILVDVQRCLIWNSHQQLYEYNSPLIPDQNIYTTYISRAQP